VTKSLVFGYSSSIELLSLFEDFRLMCNDAIRVAVQRNPRNRFELIEAAYVMLRQFGLHTHYVLAACEVAFSAYRNKNRKSIPYVNRAFLKLDNQSYHLSHLLLRIPTRPRNFIFLRLQGSKQGSKLDCPKCDKAWDRDVLASRNIMACAVPQARPSNGSNEGE